MLDDAVSVDDTFAVASGALPQAARGTVALENPPAAAAVQQAAQLASWEDEGGTASS